MSANVCHFAAVSPYFADAGATDIPLRSAIDVGDVARRCIRSEPEAMSSIQGHSQLGDAGQLQWTPKEICQGSGHYDAGDAVQMVDC